MPVEPRGEGAAAPAPPDQSIWPLLRSRWAKLALAAACAALLAYCVYAVRGVLIPFGLAVVTAYIFDPVVGFLHARLRLPRALIVVALMTVLTAVLVGAVAMGIAYAVRTVERVVPSAQRALSQAHEPDGFADRVRSALESIPNEIRVQIEEAIQSLPATIRQNFSEISSSVFLGFGAVFRALLGGIVVTFKFVLYFVVTGYVLADLPMLREKARALLPEQHKERILRMLGDIDANVHAYYRGQFIVALFLCVIYSVGLTLCGVDFAVLIGVAGGLADVVPYLGLVVGMIPALLFGFVPYVGLLKPLGVVLVFAFGETVAGLFIAPRIVGKKMGLHPVTLLLAIMVFGYLLGFLGVLFAAPLASAVRVLGREAIQSLKRSHEASVGSGR